MHHHPNEATRVSRCRFLHAGSGCQRACGHVNQDSRNRGIHYDRPGLPPSMLPSAQGVQQTSLLTDVYHWTGIQPDTISEENNVTLEPTTTTRYIHIQPHRPGVGWRYLWEFDPPIDHQVRGEDGTPYYWRECGGTSEGTIMFLAGCFAREQLGTTARELYRLCLPGRR
jgi:hypothetical protein